MSTGKKILKFLSSMQFAVILLTVLAAACCAASFISQGQTYEWYAGVYSERTAAIIMALHLDDAFHSWWFVMITLFLCLNLFFCNVVRLPQLVERTKKANDPLHVIKGPVTCSKENVRDPELLIQKMHMPKARTVQTEDGKTILFSQKNTAGIWGAWVCHLGILLLIAGFGLGQMLKQEYTVYGVPGQTKQVGETSYWITIDNFETRRNPNGTLDQYITELTMRDVSSTDGTGKSASVTVNGPASMYGYRIYQNSTGWAADMTITKSGEVLQEQPLCAGEFAPVKDKPELVIYLNAVYPDLIAGANGMPATASEEPNNPGYLYSVYYMNEIIGMNILEKDDQITIDDYTVSFHDPQNYTLVQVKKDSFAWLAFIGGMLTLIGLLLAFYLQRSVMWAEKTDKGYTVYGFSPKAGVLFKEQFDEAAAEKE